MKKIWFLLFFSPPLLVCFNSPAQSSQDTLSLYHIKSGMSQSSATQILEDQEGFLWIGTTNGLNKYDGTNFQVFDITEDGKTGLLDGYIQKLYEDEEGNIYVGTNKGLNIYDRSLNVIKPYPFNGVDQATQKKYFGAIWKDPMYLWLGSYNDGIYRYSPNNGEVSNLEFQKADDNADDNYIVEIFPVGENLLIVTQLSIYVINKEMEIISQTEIPLNNSCAHRSEVANQFWIGSHNGTLTRLKVGADYSLMTESITISAGVTLLSIVEGKNGNVWIGSENDGLYIYSTNTSNLSHFETDATNPGSISSNSIWSLLQAKNGVIWMGTFKQGLSFYDPKYFKFQHIQTNPFKSDGLSNDIVSCFLEDEKGNFWIGTDGGGLDYWDRKKGSFTNYSIENGKLSTNVVLSLYKDRQGNLWVGSWANGISILNPRGQEIRRLTKANSFLGSDNVLSMIEDEEGLIWIAALFGGLHVYDPIKDTYRHVSLPSFDNSESNSIARLYLDSDQNMWVGTQTSGLFKVRKEQNDFSVQQYANELEGHSISNDFINCITQDIKGTVWIGTQAGLLRYEAAKDSFLTITKADGLKDDAIKGIIPDREGFLWLGTSNGIIRYHPASGEISDYDLYDGLQGNEFNASASYYSVHEELLFGGSNGFNIFTIDQAVKRTNAPPVYISNIRVFNQPVLATDSTGILEYDISQTKSLTLSHKESVVDFDFNALTFRHPYKVQYAYFLEGFESTWNYVGNSSIATYTSLDPGNYTLRIKSTNSDGVWNDRETQLAITVTPPFWNTWWFRFSLVGLLGIFVYLFFMVRTRRIRKYQIELEKQIKERTKELEEQKEKIALTADELARKNEEIQQFAFGVSHDLKSPLATIKGFAEMISEDRKIKKDENLKGYLTVIDKSSKTMDNLISDITTIARLGKIENNKELLKTNEVIQSAQELVIGKLRAKNVNLKIQSDLPDIFGDRNRMIQVFENLIDNAVKYMGDQKNPVVSIEHQAHSKMNEFRVIDNGSGMNQSALDGLFVPFERFNENVEGTGLGLYMIQKIVESHDGKITAMSEGINTGSTFIVSLPITGN